MLPVLPSKTTPELDDLILRVLSGSAALGRGIHPLIIDEVVRFMLKVNSYYTNAMEGNPSKLRDIDNALHHKFLKDKTARNYQLEHVAHIQVQEAMIKLLRENPELNICSEEFLSWLHAQFFLKLPEDMRWAKTISGKLVKVEPGALRNHGITVGRHHAPASQDEIREHLTRFKNFLNPDNLNGSQKLLGMAASHHRFLWIHPFPEGNGRVARLLTTAYGVRIGVGDTMLWTVSRAFARNRDAYDAHLSMADQPRRNDYDGRGPLSEENLLKFCTFFLRCCDDQIRFMDSMLQLGELEKRYKRFIDRLVVEKELSKSGAIIMHDLLLRGAVARGSIPELCDVKQRRATQIVRELLDIRLTHSETAYGSLRLNITPDMAASLFPELA